MRSVSAAPAPAVVPLRLRATRPALAFALALALVLPLALTVLASAPAVAAQPQTTPATPIPATQPVTQPDISPIPAPPAPSAQPAGEDVPPPFVKRPAQPARPQRPDLTFAQGKAPLEFRGLPWGTSLDKAKAQMPDLAPVTSPISLKDTFARKDELLKLGEADLKSVAYYFPKGRFSGVGIVFEGEANFFLIKEQLIRQFGPGRQMGDRYGWTWQNFFVEMRLRGQTGELRYTYAP